MEALYPNGSRLCSLPDLPHYRHGHTQDGLTACGGFISDVQPNCYNLTLTDGQWSWTQSHQLLSPRRVHTSWSIDDELIIIGGKGHVSSPASTEVLSPGNFIPTTSFTLKYDTW